MTEDPSSCTQRRIAFVFPEPPVRGFVLHISFLFRVTISVPVTSLPCFESRFWFRLWGSSLKLGPFVSLFVYGVVILSTCVCASEYVTHYCVITWSIASNIYEFSSNFSSEHANENKTLFFCFVFVWLVLLIESFKTIVFCGCFMAYIYKQDAFKTVAVPWKLSLIGIISSAF